MGIPETQLQNWAGAGAVRLGHRSIPESQLQTWANPGAIAAAQVAHTSIRAAIDGTTWNAGVNYEIFLQGSYKNDTNIWADSDVDVVVQFDSTYYSDTSLLNPIDKAKYDNAFVPAKYAWRAYRDTVLKVLQDYYSPLTIGEGNYCLKVPARSGALQADVLVCTQYRQYVRYTGDDSDFFEGVTFWTRSEDRQVINYPKYHYHYGVEKNTATNGRYKHTVRVFKNARNYLIDKKVISADLAPSYFIECMLSNVPNPNFGGTFAETAFMVLKWFETADFSTFQCQSRLTPLFGNSPEQWSIDKAKLFRDAVIRLWNNWPST
jgi:hypothetical protein